MSVDIEPATARLAELVRTVEDDQLAAPSPNDITVGQLLDHIQAFAAAFSAAAAKSDDEITAGPAPAPDAARLGDDWRERIPR